MINFKEYNRIILDFDGVILDSNSIKEDAIFQSSYLYLDKKLHKEFLDYFTGNNGIPRELKIKKYFSDKDIFDKVLNNYNELLRIKLFSANFTKNLDIFLKKLDFYNLKPYILSGGDRSEVVSLLYSKEYLNRFDKIMGGPLTKYENLGNLNFKGKVLYIGDSRIDYEVAKEYNFDFIFMYGYSQFKNWKEFFKDKKEVKIIKNFEALTFSHC